MRASLYFLPDTEFCPKKLSFALFHRPRRIHSDSRTLSHTGVHDPAVALRGTAALRGCAELGTARRCRARAARPCRARRCEAQGRRCRCRLSFICAVAELVASLQTATSLLRTVRCTCPLLSCCSCSETSQPGRKPVRKPVRRCVCAGAALPALLTWLPRCRACRCTRPTRSCSRRCLASYATSQASITSRRRRLLWRRASTRSR